jgi:peroxiredoxin
MNSMKDKYNMVGKKIQEFTLPNSGGDQKNIRDFQGKYVLLILLRSIY